MTGTEAHCHQHPFYLFIAASTFGLHLCFGDGCFRRCVAQFCDMFEYTNPVRGVQAKNSWLKISVKTSVRSSPPPSEAFSISLAFQLLQEKRHYGVPLNCHMLWILGFQRPGSKEMFSLLYTAHVCRQNRGPWKGLL